MFGFDLPLWAPALIGFGRKAVGALFTFFSKPPGLYVLIAAVLAGAIWWNGARGYSNGLAQGRADEQLHIEQAIALAAKEGARRQAALDKGLIAAADHAGFLRGKAQARTITITREIPRYVTLETDRLFPVPCGLVRLHDAAAFGADPASLDNPSGLADGDACPVTASYLAGVIVENYGLDHEKDAMIIGLQDLVRALAEAASKPPQVSK